MVPVDNSELNRRVLVAYECNIDKSMTTMKQAFTQIPIQYHSLFSLISFKSGYSKEARELRFLEDKGIPVRQSTKALNCTIGGSMKSKEIVSWN